MTDRKARLAALAAKAGRSKQLDDENKKEDTPKVNFRNYVPQDASLVVAPKNKEEDNDEPEEPVTKKPKLEEALEQAQQEVSAASQTTTLVETKKINWDLKRDLEPQLDKLERKTQRAMVEILKERLAKEATEEDLD